jgi:tRNA(Ile)-lysidine synthase
LTDAGPDPLIAALLAGLDQAGFAGPGPFGLAVSGGGDSMALLHLAHDAGLAAEVATVDHRLRPEAADEARLVAAQSARLGYRHETLVWDGPSATGNLPDAARLARRRLLANWARRRGLGAVLLAHTADDLAETFLMRLARGAGVDGLAAMAPAFHAEDVPFLRPLLAVRRSPLRDWLTARALPWAEDPTNRDPAYDRTRARAALQALDPLGLTVPRLAEVAHHLADARQALTAATTDLLAAAVTVEAQGLALRLDAPRLFAAPADLLRRALVAMILYLVPAPYAPRGPQLAHLTDRLRQGQPAQLQGVRFLTHQGRLWACREAKSPVPDPRWHLEGPLPQGAVLRTLGPDGLGQCPDWRATGLPRAALLTAPSLWQGDRLLAAPQAGLPAGFRLHWSGGGLAAPG